jgi:LacI family transcriptional regulator
MLTLLDRQVDAVFAASDLMAIGAIRAIRDVGLSVPNEIAVAGFDDIPFAAMATPPLTTIRQPISQLGEEVTRVLVSQLDGASSEVSQKMLPVELIVRQSTVRKVD